VAYLGFGKGGPWRARRARAYEAIWGRSPWSGGQGGEAPWSWNTFCFWTFNGGRKFAHFFWNLLENGKKRTFSYKVACKKFSWSGQRGASPLGQTDIGLAAMLSVVLWYYEDRHFHRRHYKKTWVGVFFWTQCITQTFTWGHGFQYSQMFVLRRRYFIIVKF